MFLCIREEREAERRGCGVEQLSVEYTYALTRSFRSAMLKRRPITKTKKLRAAPTDNMIANMVQSNDFAVVKRSQRFRMLQATPPSAKGQ